MREVFEANASGGGWTKRKRTFKTLTNHPLLMFVTQFIAQNITNANQSRPEQNDKKDKNAQFLDRIQ